jgi:Flp pilus assembly protein TadG
MTRIAARLMARRARRVRRVVDERGVTMIIFGLILVALLIIVAIVIDLGNARQEKRQLQNAADAAALAGASPLFTSGAANACPTAVTYSYNNLQLGAVTGSCSSGNYSQTVGNVQLTVATPYTGGPSAFSADSLINVKACKDVPTSFARIIGVTSVHVCGNATARKVGQNNQCSGSGCGTQTSDPDAPCTVDAFTQNGYFDKNHQVQNNPKTDATGLNFNNQQMNAVSDSSHSGGPAGGPIDQGQWVGATYSSTTDIDLTNNPPKFTLTNTTTGTVVASNTWSNSPTTGGPIYIKRMTTINGQNVSNTFAYDIVWKVPNFPADNSTYTVTMSVYDSTSSSFPPNGKCGKAQWTAVRGHPPVVGGSTCGEDIFLGAVWVIDGTTGQKNSGLGASVKPGDTIGATYQDESPIFNVLDTSDPSYADRHIKFMDGSTEIPEDGLVTPPSSTLGPNTVHQPFTAGTPTDHFTLTSGSTLMTSREHYSTDIMWKLPPSIANGTHSISLKAYDGDNNKTGGDCGNGAWSISVSGGGSTTSDVMLVQ